MRDIGYMCGGAQDIGVSADVMLSRQLYRHIPVDSFWCMWMVTQVSKLVRWFLVSSLRRVIMTNSRRMASVFFMFLVMMDLSVLASVNAACTVTGAVAAK